MTQSGEATKSNVFDLTNRGYSPHQVDGHVQALLARVEGLEHAHRQQQQRAAQAEAELARTRELLERAGAERGGGETSLPEGFGHRIERVLRVAEQEAVNARATATREAAALMERTRAEADARRQEVEHDLEARRASLDEEAARRRGALDARERELDEQTAATRQEAEHTLAEARMGAEQITREAEEHAQRRRADTDADIAHRHHEAKQELERLHGLHHGVRTDLGRLLDSLSGQLPPDRPAPPAPEQHPASETSQDASGAEQAHPEQAHPEQADPEQAESGSERGADAA
jgi:hypothetical protein